MCEEALDQGCAASVAPSLGRSTHCGGSLSSGAAGLHEGSASVSSIILRKQCKVNPGSCIHGWQILNQNQNQLEQFIKTLHDQNSTHLIDNPLLHSGLKTAKLHNDPTASDLKTAKLHNDPTASDPKTAELHNDTTDSDPKAAELPNWLLISNGFLQRLT